MIKYFEFLSEDCRGNYIHSIEKNAAGLIKTASNNYSPEIMEAIAALKRDSQYYYVVINALGSYEIWGANRNGDAFPRAALSHYSLRTDMGTKEDYGYKTFEYYAHLYAHHVNKDPNKGFGKVFFSSWNPRIERVELIVGIDKLRGFDMIEAIENGDLLAVSMGAKLPFDQCFTKGTMIECENKLKRIEDIAVGDLVKTHMGNTRPVTTIMNRKYSGDLYSFKIDNNILFDGSCTKEHPYLVLKKDEARSCHGSNDDLKRRHSNIKNGKCSRCYDAVSEPRWTEAKDIAIGDYLVYPIKKSNGVYFDRSLAYLCGMYLGDGFLVRQRRGEKRDGEKYVQAYNFSINKNDLDIIKKIKESIYDYSGADTSINIYEESDGKQAVKIIVYDQDTCSIFSRTCGEKSLSKYIHEDVLSWSVDNKLSFIGGYLDSDGSVDMKKGTARFISVSENVIYGLRNLMYSLGWSCSVENIGKPSGYKSKNDAYLLHLGCSYVQTLKGYSVKADKSNIKSTQYSRIMVGDTFMAFEVYEINKSTAHNVDVYNFSVRDDESYVANGVAVHNCSICDNKARTTKEYCKHLKLYMGKVVTEEQAIAWSIELGKKILPGASVHAWNYNPRFFDISKVFIGADSTSYSLGKVASAGRVVHSAILGEVDGTTDEDIDKLAVLGKSSSIEKVIDGDSMNTGDGKMIDKGKAAAIRKMLDASFAEAISKEPEIPRQTLDTLASNFDLKQIFSTMLGMGIHPHPREVQRIVIISVGHKDVADLLDDRNLCFDDDEVVEDPIEMDIGNNNFDPAIAKLLMPMMLKRSCFPDYLMPRMEKTAENNDPTTSTTTVLGPAALLSGVAALYAGLRMKAMGASNSQMFDLFRNQAWIPKMLGTGLSYKIMVLDKQRELDKMYVPARNYENAFFPSGFTGYPNLTKTSSVGGSLALGALGATVALPAGYVLNAYHRKSMYEKGQGLFPGSGASPIAVAGLVGGGTAAASLLKDHFSKDLFKKVVTKAK